MIIIIIIVTIKINFICIALFIRGMQLKVLYIPAEYKEFRIVMSN